MKRKIKLYECCIRSFIMFTAISFCGCKKFVTIDPPVDQIVSQTVFSTNATATAAQLGIYANWANSTLDIYHLSLFTGLSSDELTNYSTDLGYVGYYTNTINPVNEQTNNIWYPAYGYIYKANTNIEGLTNNTKIAPKIRQQLLGEAEFVRAFWHFYLTNVFGDVPLVTSTDYTVNDVITKTPQAQVYQQIIADLKDAQSKLNSNFVDGSDTTVTTARVRPTKWAATALLARVYLYMGDYQDAYIQANSIISNPGQFNLAPLNQVFNANNQEAIWQLQPNTTLYDTQEGFYFILTTTPSTGSTNCATISPQLLSAFEANDARKINWIGSVTVGTQTYYFPNKYKIRVQATTEASTILRLAEQYLIRAEAQAKGSGVGNGLSGAIADLNVIRNRASLPPYSGSVTDANAVFNAIMHERQVELFTEGGHRWFDLKRTGLVNTVIGPPGNVYQAKGSSGTWSPNWALYPIPQTEINTNPKLIQNTGY